MIKLFRIICIGLVGLTFAFDVSADSANLKRDLRPEYLAKRMCEIGKVKIVRAETSAEGWIWIGLEWYDEKYPIAIDLVASNEVFKTNTKILYLVAPSGLSFRSMFAAPPDRNLTKFMSKNGYIVVGVTFREDRVPAAEVGDFLAGWGLRKHTRDLGRVVDLVQSILPLRYDMLGQESAAVSILDFASSHRGGLERTILLDTDSFDPSIDPQKIEFARTTYDALTRTMSNGTYHEQFTSGIRDLTVAGTLYPEVDSGVPRSAVGLPGNFTYGGLLHFSLIYTASLPGMLTPVTGLPGQWVMKQGIAAGHYDFNPDPLLDDFGLAHTDLEDLSQGVSLIRDGIAPLALSRDIFGILSLSDDGYRIDWRGIRAKVILVNGEYSSGDQTYYATLIRQHGNPNVAVHVIRDYAYLDLLFGKDAEKSVWPLFLE